MKIREQLTFEPLKIIHNTLDDALLREGRRTIWGDLSPGKEGLERAELNQIPYTYGLFIQSKDGKAVDSLTGGVGRMAGSPADRYGQLELRAAVDAFLIGAGTLRADWTVGAPFEQELIERRRREKGDDAPLNVFFSASGDFPADAPVFQQPEIKTALFVTGTAADKVADLRKSTPDVTVVGTESPLREMWRELWRRGIMTIGFEGGPRLMGLALNERLVHELLLTHSPQLLGGTGPSFADTESPLEGTRVEPIFLGLDASSNLLFERSRVIYD
ncbi:MAG: RibD family protein [Gemmatimonadota bacterium]